jgi:hypothetical protein
MLTEVKARIISQLTALMRTIRSADVPPLGAFQNPAPVLLITCALLAGLLLGLLASAPEQRAMHGSLVLSGIVNYPAQSPMSAYFLDSWTIIHQLGSLLLRAGIHQTYVNKIIFIIPSALIVCAYTMIIYSFSEHFFVSLLAAVLCYKDNPLARFFASPDYTTLGLLWGQPSEHTFGLWGQIGAVWVIGCVAGGRQALAGFSALVLIAVHPVLGVYMAGLLVITVFIGAVYFKLNMRGFVKGMACGAALTILSFVFYLKTRSGFSGDSNDTAFDVYMRVWDVHRNIPMTISEAFRIGIVAVLSTTLLSAFILFVRRPASAVLTSALVVLAVIISTIAYFAAHTLPNLMPEFVIRAAPGRLLNVQAYVSTPIAVALAFSVANYSTKYWKSPAVSRIVERVALVVLLVAIVTAAVHSFLHGRAATPKYDEAFWNSVRGAGINGLVLESPTDAWVPTLYHGHLPVALYAESFDFIPYLPQTAGSVAHIVEEGYGVSFSNPSPDMRHRAGLSSRAVQEYWTRLTADEWCRISRDLGVGAVVAPSKWMVRLPIFVPGPDFTLYEIKCTN